VAAKPGKAVKPAQPAQVAANQPDEAAIPADEMEATPAPMARPNAGKAGKPGKKKDELESFIAEHVKAPQKTDDAGHVLPPQVVQRRNQEFDRWRSRGIALVYEQRTAESIAAFKRALALRPGDPSVTRWLGTIQGVIDKHNNEERERFEKEKAEALQKMIPPPEPVRAGGLTAPPGPPSMPNLPPAARPIKDDDAAKMYEELKKQDKVPLLAPPKTND
jgi:hypothetical protein